jgi:hypothetical protein
MRIHKSRELRLAWAAGFIDGEGCLWAGQCSRQFVILIDVAQRVEAPLLELQEIFGCGSLRLRTSKSLVNPVYRWQVKGSNDVSLVLRLVRPFLIVKAEQADILQQICGSTRLFGSAARDPEYRSMMIDLAKDLRLAKPQKTS